MEKGLFFIFIFIATSLFAYIDADMDGVADSLDKCPNTPFMELVDKRGCTKKVLIPKSKKHHFDIIVGTNYSGSNYASLNQTDTLSTSLQCDYYYGKFSLQVATSYYKTDADDYDREGFNDSFVGIAYNIKPNKNLLIRIGIGSILATYKTDLGNNNTDYTGSLNISYTYKTDINIFASYVYTKINDDNVVTSNNIEYFYHNTNAFSGGFGYYFTRELYFSTAYNTSESIYQDIEDIDTVSLYGYKSINKNWFVTLFYAYGLSDSASDHAASMKIGYYF